MATNYLDLNAQIGAKQKTNLSNWEGQVYKNSVIATDQNWNMRKLCKIPDVFFHYSAVWGCSSKLMEGLLR